MATVDRVVLTKGCLSSSINDSIMTEWFPEMTMGKFLRFF